MRMFHRSICVPRVPRAPRATPVRAPLRPAAAGTTEALVETSRLVGQGMILFVLFTTTANWWYYRRWREEAEARQKKDKK
jgi:hypothetical protein